MKKFIVYLFSIILITYCVALIIQGLSDYGLKRNSNSIYEDWNSILKGKVNAKIVINGSSRGCVSYDTRVIDSITKLKSHNLGFNAGGYKLQQEKFLMYLERNTAPKIIIQSIDLTHFNENNIIPDEHQFIPFISDLSINQFLLKYDEKYNYLNYIPLLKYNQNFKLLKEGILSNFIKSEPKYFVVSGFTPKDKKFKLDDHNLKKLDSYIENQDLLDDKIKNKLSLVENYYKQILLKNPKTILFFVWAPENKERLTDKYKPIYETLKNRLKLLESQNKNIYFLDFSNDVISNSNDYFYDSFHLNKTGAKEFSIKLSNKINTILK